ncbi:MAG: magnesium transporter [Clostridia bacterium]|nr:magnesium transporter [Clostridia bacterium]MBR3839111.1 magnesium transporter [Clostridia bacterium]
MEITIRDIIELLINKQYKQLRATLENMYPYEIAALFNELNKEYVPVAFRLLPKELAAETFVEMDSDAQELLIKSFSDSELKEVIEELYVDDAVDIVEEMPANVVRRMLAQATPEMRRSINEILKYPELSAGSIMTTEFVELKSFMSVTEAITRIRRTGVDKETIDVCYVTAGDRKLIGVISLRTLILAEEDSIVADLMEINVISVNTLEDREEAANMFNKYNVTTLPVVDNESRLVGIITVDDAIEVIEEEVTEDIEKMAAIVPGDKPYLKTGVFETWMRRIPWLLLLMISATFTGGIINSFEKALTTVPILISFIPMLMDTGGNAGGQTSVTIIRSMAIGDVEMRDIFRVIWKELRTSILCGMTLAAVGFVKILLVDNMIFKMNVSYTEAFVICVTIMITVIFAKIVGCVLPMFAKRIGLDPAVMASPFITTIVDAISLSIFFIFATWFLL